MRIGGTMKLDNKGFAASTILYGSLTITLVLLLMILAIMKANNETNRNIAKQVENHLNKCINMDIILQECKLSKSTCKEELGDYQDCLNQVREEDKR